MNNRIAAALLASTCFMTAATLVASSSYAADSAVPTVSDGIGGVVTSAKGPEAGVWVIAETKDLPTRFIKIVVTDDQGRYVLPQLPKAKYKLWVRGYGLVDSKQVDGMPGKNVDLTAVVAPNAQAAAQYYPANYWFSLIKPPAANEFPGTGPQGNGIAPVMQNQQRWLVELKEGCQLCHQFGDKATRELANNSVEGWSDRLKLARDFGDPALGNTGPAYATIMQNNIAQFGRDRALKMYADWSARIAKGEVPTETPPRPAGIERNVVLSIWDWGHGHFLHDEVTTDRRNPSTNANGPVYAVAPGAAFLEILDPKKNAITEVPMPGNGLDHDINVFVHNPMVDQKGRVWLTDSTRSRQILSAQAKGTPLKAPPLGTRAESCTNGDLNKFAKYYPMAGNNTSQIGVYDPATKKVELFPSCFGVHHLGFAHDKDNTLFFSGDGNVVGWLNTKVWDETHDPVKAQGWCPMVLDTKERGVTKVALGGKDEVTITPDRTQWNVIAPRAGAGGGEGEGPSNRQAGQPPSGGGGAPALDPKKDTRISGFLYGMDVNPKDGSIWYAKNSPSIPTGIVRMDRGAHPPETCKTEYYEPPKNADGSYVAFDARAVSFDSKGVAWVAFGSGQFATFDREKCKVMNGPTATGQHCPEGWKFTDIPGPRIPGTNVAADWHYQNWTDQFNTLGLGKDVPLTNGTNSDSLIAMIPGSGQIVHFRVPYPMGYYGRGMDGRIDDAKAGWKGRGVWSTFGMAPLWHQEGGDEGAGPEMVHFQVRPDPLAH